MKIALVSSEYPPFRGGGIGTYTAIAARVMAEAGHEVHVLANGWQARDEHRDFRGAAGDASGRLVVHRIPALDEHYGPAPPHDLPGDPLGWLCRVRECSIYWSFRVAEALDRLAQEVAPDVVELPECFAEGWAMLGRRGRLKGALDVPVALTLHSPIHEIAEYNLLRRTDGWVMRRGAAEDLAIRQADAIASPSRLLGEMVSARLGLDPAVDPVTVIPNPMDFDRVGELSATAADGRRRLVFVGRNEPRKGLLNLVRAAVAVLGCGHPEALVELVGREAPAGSQPGSLTDQLRSLIPSKLQDQFIFRDQAPREEVLQLFASAAACVFMPDWDNFPYTCCEAMAVGGAVIVSANSGMAEMVEHGRSGLVVAPGDQAALEQAMDELLGNPERGRQLGLAAAERIRRLCHTSHFLELKIPFYERTIDRHRRSMTRSVSMSEQSPHGRVRLAVLCLAAGDAEGLSSSVAALEVSARKADLDLELTVAGADKAKLAEHCPGGRILVADTWAEVLPMWLEALYLDPPAYVLTLAAGELVDETFLEITDRVFRSDEATAWVTTWSLPVDGTGEPFAGLDFTLPLELLDYHPVPFAVVRWSAFSAVEGWNLDLPDGWRQWDLWLALHGAGRKGVVVPVWAAHHLEGSGVPLPVEHAKAYEMVLEAVAKRNADLFAGHGASLWIKGLVDRPSPPCQAPRPTISTAPILPADVDEAQEETPMTRQPFVDLVRSLAEAEVEAPEGHVGEAAFFEAHPLGGLGLLAHPPTRIGYRLTLSSRSFLNLSLGLHPSVWDQPGGGVRFEVMVDGETVLDEQVDPKRQPEHRGWKDVSVDLSRFAGDDRLLELRTESFPGEDRRFCTAGWGRAHLAAEPLAPAPKDAEFQR